MHPIRKDSEGKTVLKPEESWSSDEDHLENSNLKALNAISNAVDASQFKLISIDTCETAKEAWTIFETAYEGTIAVKLSNLQFLATGFENLKMLENETIADFNAKLCDIANESWKIFWDQTGEKHLEISTKAVCL